MLIDIVYWVFKQHLKSKTKELLKIDFVTKIEDNEKTQNDVYHKLKDKKFNDRERIR